MRIINNNFSNSNLCILHDKKWLEDQRIAGRIAAECLVQLEDYVKGKTLHSMATHAEAINRYIIKEGGRPTFWNYGKGKNGSPFPGFLCISINQKLVHGIPDDTILKDGDIISFDLGVTYNESISDTAITCIFGKPNSDKDVQLVHDGEEALMKGIEQVKIGNRHGAIGNAISKYAKNKGWGNITAYGGHHLAINKPHAFPFVSNEGSSNEGIRFAPGMSFCIEPMLTSGSTKTWIDKSDGWTVWCEAKSSCHWEHTLYLHEDRIEIITDRTGL